MIKYCEGQKALKRDSNMELLRIIAMVLIVLVHFNGRGIPNFELRSPIVWNIFESFSCIGVNLFILISGYYSIKLKWKSLINLYCICLFYSTILTLLQPVILSEPLTMGNIINMFFPISRHWWFVNVYFCLVLCSPFLNKAIDNLNNKEMLVTAIPLFVVNCYFGYFCNNAAISGNGYSLVNFIFVYYIGSIIKRFEKKSTYKSGILVVCYIVFFFITATLAMLPHFRYIAYHYNNPFILMSAVSFFLLFKKLNFKSRFVNWVASSVFAVYLIHIHVPLFNDIIFPFNTNSINYVGYSGIELSIHILILLIGIFWGCILVDQIRIFIMKPIVSYLTKITNKLQNIVIEKVYNHI